MQVRVSPILPDYSVTHQPGCTQYYLTNHSEQTPFCALAAAIKARWSCEQAHRQSKEELGLDPLRGSRPVWLAPPRAHDAHKFYVSPPPMPARSSASPQVGGKSHRSAVDPRRLPYAQSVAHSALACS
jgi:hypothetical protein